MTDTSNDRTTPLKPLKWYKTLASRKGRREADAFIVEGERSIRQIIGSHPEAIIEIVTVAEPLPVYRNYEVRRVNESQFNAISPTRTPQGIMAIVRQPPDTYSSRMPADTGTKILLLEDIQDPGNVGALIRTAAAFAFSGVILTEKCADPLSPKCVQSTAGAVLSVWLRRVTHYLELVQSLHKGGYAVAAAELNGVDDPSILSRQEKLVLALGNEASGLTNSILNESDYRINIPTTREKAESLNVAACGAICMYLSSLD
ncbi:TrmH family RNA methyltransferase [Chloroflexota bacterium]